MNREYKAQFFITGLALLLPVVMGLSIMTGAVSVSLQDFITLLQKWLGIQSPEDSGFSQAGMVLEVIRIPRMLLGALVGSTLAICGGAMQGLFRNPLADPSIIGVSSGSALGAGIGIVLVGFLPAEFVSVLQLYTVPVMAFLGGLGATLLVYRIGTTSYGSSVATMLLAGIAISALSGAGMGILYYVADDAMLRNLAFWQMGSLGGATWDKFLFIAPVLLGIQFLLVRQAKGLNALLLGESEARHLGHNIQNIKILLIILTALGVGLSVSASGMIGFVGLVVPHLVRMTVGPDHRYLLPASALLGASLLTVADILSRIVISPAELPIGIVTALLGAPFFMSLLWRQRNRIG